MKNKLQTKKKLGLVHGVFDVIHIGHLWYFKSAKKLVEKLVVSVTADKYVDKGPGKPIFDIDKRVEMLKSISDIDEVLISNNKTAVEIIKKIKPDLYIKGSDYKNLKSDLSNQIKIEKKAIESVGGKLKFTDTPLFSSSSLINKNFNFLNEEAKKYFDNFGSKKTILKNKFSNFIKKKSDKKILLIGDPIIDTIKFVLPSGKSNKNTIIATRFKKKEVHLGGSLLVANFISQFFNYIDYLFIGNLKDLKFIKKKLNKNIKIHFIYSENNMINKIRYTDSYSKNKFFQVNENEDLKFNSEIKNKILKFTETFFKKTDKILFFNYGYNYNFEKLISKLQKVTKKLILNCQTNSYNFGFNIASKYKKSDILIVDENELRLLLNNNEDNLYNLLLNNKKKLRNFRIFVVTQGRVGSYVLYKNKIFFIPTILKGNLDTIGCGDIYLSMFSVLMLSKMFDVEEASIIAHVAAGIHANQLGNRLNLEKNYLFKILNYSLK